jgi:hypothetical protein
MGEGSGPVTVETDQMDQMLAECASMLMWCKFARFVKVYNCTDRIVQLADIELPREDRFRVTTRPSESLDKFKVEFKLALGYKRGSQLGPSCEKNRR